MQNNQAPISLSNILRLPFSDHPITNKILYLIHNLLGERRITEEDLNVIIDGFETDRYAFVAAALRSKAIEKNEISLASYSF